MFENDFCIDTQIIGDVIQNRSENYKVQCNLSHSKMTDFLQ